MCSCSKYRQVNLGFWLATKADHVALSFTCFCKIQPSWQKDIRYLNARGENHYKGIWECSAGKEYLLQASGIYERVGKSVISIDERPKKANKCILSLCDSRENALFLRFTHILNKVPLQPLKRDAKLKLGMWKGCQLPIKTKLNARLAIRQRVDLLETNISACPEKG